MFRQASKEFTVGFSIKLQALVFTIRMSLIRIEKSGGRFLVSGDPLEDPHSTWAHRYLLAAYALSAVPTQYADAAFPTPKVKKRGTGFTTVFSLLPV